MKDRYKTYVKCIGAVAVVVFLVIKGIWREIEFGDALSYATTITTVLVVAYTTFFWRYNPLEKTPKLKKQYTGTLISTYDNKERDVDIKIKQSLFETKVEFQSGESSSVSITSNFYDEFGEIKLSFGYINNPKAIYKDRSPIHYGMCIFKIKDADHLEGQYFTDRNTRGDIKLTSLECVDRSKKEKEEIKIE